MLAFAEPLDRLREAVRWFMAAPELKLLHVHASAELRLAALREIAAQEAGPHNRSLVVLSDVPAEGNPADWEARANQLDGNMTARREQAAAHGVVIAPPMPPPATSRGLERFARTVRGHIDALPPPVSGLIVVLSPSAIGHAAQWIADGRLLVQSPLLQRARFLFVEGDPAPVRAVAAELGARAECVDARANDGATSKALARMLASMKTAPRGADSARLAGMAGPRAAPPPRGAATGKGRLDPAVADAELAKAEVPLSAANPEVMQALRVELLSAALAQREGRGEVAVRHQARARDLARGAGLDAQGTLLDLMLGGHLIQAGSFSAAEHQFEQVIQNARASSQPKLEAQAHMAKGGTLLAQQRPHESARAYMAGGAVAEKAGAHSIAIECFRMVGQLLLGLGNEAEAGAAFRRALAVANASPRVDAALSSAPEAARALAAICRSNGLLQQAASLEAQAEDWQATMRDAAPSEEAPPPTAPPGDPSGSNGSGRHG